MSIFGAGLKQTITQNQLLKLYEPSGKYLGGGAQGFVEGGVIKETDECVAVKISQKSWYNPTVYEKINEALHSTPHLARVHAMHLTTSTTTSNRSAPKSLQPKGEDRGSIFFNKSWQHWDRNKKITLLVTVMDLLEGDLERIHPQVTEALKLQIIFTEKIIRAKHSLVRSDPKLKNVAYKKLSPNDTFNGKKMIEYDYWKYRLEGADYYVPRPDILIKLIDFDDWMVKEPSNFTRPIDQKFKELFPKPEDPNATILDISQAPEKPDRQFGNGCRQTQDTLLDKSGRSSLTAPDFSTFCYLKCSN